MPLIKNNILFRIPIYPESYQDYYEYLTRKHDQSVKRKVSNLKKLGLNIDKSFEKDLQDNQPFIKPWNYNRIIGWIEFYADGGIIKTDLRFTRSKRIRKDLSKQIIDYIGKISDVSSTYYKDNELIRKDLRDFLNLFQSGELGNRYKNYFIDSAEFLKLIEYLDIKKMIEDIINKEKRKSKNSKTIK